MDSEIEVLPYVGNYFCFFCSWLPLYSTKTSAKETNANDSVLNNFVHFKVIKWLMRGELASFTEDYGIAMV